MDTFFFSLLLLGKTGYGKSSTGNLLLNKKRFKKSGNTSSVTKSVESDEVQFGSNRLKVVDGPGLEDVDLSSINDKKAAITNMDMALALCCGRVSAFLYVIKYGHRSTQEDKSTLDALRAIFGDTFLRHVIIVMTGRDTFEHDMEDAECGDSFHEWCGKQTGEFRQLYEDCERRAVLINNFEKDEDKKRAQVQEIVTLVEDVHNRHGFYTNECFQIAEKKREKMLLELDAPRLITEFGAKIAELTLEIVTFSITSGSGSQDNITQRVLELRKEIEDSDKGHGVLAELFDQMTRLQYHLNDVIEMKRLHEGMASAKANRKICSQVGQTFAQASAHIAQVSPKVGIGGVAVSALFTAISVGACLIKENDMRKKKKELEMKMNNLEK